MFDICVQNFTESHRFQGHVMPRALFRWPHRLSQRLHFWGSINTSTLSTFPNHLYSPSDTLSPYGSTCCSSLFTSLFTVCSQVYYVPLNHPACSPFITTMLRDRLLFTYMLGDLLQHTDTLLVTDIHKKSNHAHIP